MKKYLLVFLTNILLLSAFIYPATRQATATPAVVHALLFFSPSCVHCHEVMEEDLPPLTQKYGVQLVIKTIDVTTSEGDALYQAAIRQFNITSDRQGVPTLIIGDTVLVGTVEIPERLPALIEAGLKSGGIALTEINILPTPTPTAAPTPPAYVDAPLQVTFMDKWKRDPAGNSLSVAVLLLMVVMVIWQVSRRPWAEDASKTQWFNPEWEQYLIPLLVTLGLFVAGYLSFVEVTSTKAICGPVGDCNSVQNSEYARLFGFLPIALLGVMGDLSILISWWCKQYLDGAITHWAQIAQLLLAAFGILFSIYLTFLEPFVIGATCIWCLSSALIMTLVFFITCESA